jgi:hypothetical protein
LAFNGGFIAQLEVEFWEVGFPDQGLSCRSRPVDLMLGAT